MRCVVARKKTAYAAGVSWDERHPVLAYIVVVSIGASALDWVVYANPRVALMPVLIIAFVVFSMWLDRREYAKTAAEAASRAARIGDLIQWQREIRREVGPTPKARGRD
jgi:hypothetical protein